MIKKLLRKQALLIGINQYQVLPELKYARQDAEAVETALKENYDFSDVNVKLLTDLKTGLHSPSNRSVILGTLNSLSSRDYDLFIFGFWGHSFFKNGERFLCPMDVNGNSLYEMGITLNELVLPLTKIKAKNTIVILDCCQDVLGLEEIESFTASDKKLIEDITRKIALKRQEQFPESDTNVIILNSCSEGQNSYVSDERKHSLFTSYLLDSLNRRYDSFIKIVNYINSHVEATALEIDKKQTLFYKRKGDVLLPVKQIAENVTPFSPGDVFISYDRKNANLTGPIEEEFKRRKISYFIHREDCKYDIDSSEAILKAIKECKVFLVLWTKDSGSSANMIREIKIAKDLNKMIVPYRVGAFVPEENQVLYDQLSSLNRYEFPEQTPDTVTELTNRINIILIGGRFEPTQPPEGFHFSSKKPDDASAVPPVCSDKNRRPYNRKVVLAASSIILFFFLLLFLVIRWSFPAKTVDPIPSAAIPYAGSEAGERTVITVAGVSIPFRWCPAGSFPLDNDNTISFSEGFWIMESEITVDMFNAFVKETKYKSVGNDPYYIEDGVKSHRSKLSWQNPGHEQSGMHPVTCISWDDANAFCRWLGTKTGNDVHLPTETQWEYACRADGSVNVNNEAENNSAGANPLNPVASDKENAWGIHDMQGNVWEWCEDWYGSYPNKKDASSNPAPKVNSETDESRFACRYGKWDSSEGVLTRERNCVFHKTRNDQIGARCVISGVPLKLAKKAKNADYTEIISHSDVPEDDPNAFALSEPIADSGYDIVPPNHYDYPDYEKPSTESDNSTDPKTGLPLSSGTGTPQSSEENSASVPLDASELSSDGKYAGERKVVNCNGVDIAFRWCPPGTFTMGSPESESGRYDEEVQHDVTLKGFWMMETEVTVGMFKAFVNETSYKSKGDAPKGLQNNKWCEDSKLSWLNPGFYQDDRHPVTCVSYDDAWAFCRWLRAKLGLFVNFPTEGQWEYACRAGTRGAYAGNLDEMAWYNSVSGTHPVGTKKPNAWGLYDMHGNVWEWCIDLYRFYPIDTRKHRVSSSRFSEYVRRGGSWSNDARNCRSAYRYSNARQARSTDIGFRCVISMAVPVLPVEPDKRTVVVVGLNRDGATAGECAVVFVKDNEILFRWCPPGTFTMGSPESEAGRSANEKQHQVTLTKGFWMMETEVTVGMFKSFVNETGYESKGITPRSYNGREWIENPGISWRNPGFTQNDRHPVLCISWEDATAFCQWLSKKTGQNVQLPTEAQWEYACRAGSTEATPGVLDEIGWCNGSSGTYAVGLKDSNAWGLYDMIGNVWEYCNDWMGEYPNGSVTDPKGPSSGSDRVIRGSCWGNNNCPDRCRAAFRCGVVPVCRCTDIGFRCVGVVSKPFLGFPLDNSDPPKPKSPDPESPDPESPDLELPDQESPKPEPEKPAQVQRERLFRDLKYSGQNAGDRVVVEINGAEFAFRWCPKGGTFFYEKGFGEQRQQAWINKGFWITETCLTKKQWQAVMGYTSNQNDDNFYCTMNGLDYNKFYNKMLKLGFRIQLPTEEQWIYARYAGANEPHNQVYYKEITNDWGLKYEGKREWTSDVVSGATWISDSSWTPSPSKSNQNKDPMKSVYVMRNTDGGRKYGNIVSSLGSVRFVVVPLK